jgi:biopolymer transport protein ExbD
MKRREHRESLIPEGEVDLTPLIDCVFLLLIFFMVTTVFIDVKGLVVDLPSAADSQEEQQQQKKDVNIIVSADGSYTVAGDMVDSANLASAIKGAMDISNNRNVIIQGEADSTHDSVVYAMDMAVSMGAEMLAFAIEQQEGAQ